VGDALGVEGKMQMLFQVVVPSHRLFLGVVCIDYDFLLDALLPLFVLFGLGHVWMGAQPALEHEANLRDQPEDRRE
jgi:hypothetical protein